jgi:hypothetical protein
MIDVQKLTNVELRLLYDGLKELNYLYYNREERDEFFKLKLDLEIEILNRKMPRSVKMFE